MTAFYKVKCSSPECGQAEVQEVPIRYHAGRIAFMTWLSLHHGWEFISEDESYCPTCKIERRESK